MANIVKKVDGNRPGTERLQVFTEADGGAGDVFMVRDSLGKSASKVTITATAAVTIKLNVYQTVIPQRSSTNGTNMSPWGPGGDNLFQAVTYKTGNGPSLALTTGEVLELDHDLAVNDIEIISAVGAFEILVM